MGEEQYDVDIHLFVKGWEQGTQLRAIEARILESRTAGLFIVIGGCKDSDDHVVIVAHVPKEHMNTFIEATIEATSRSDWPTPRGH